METHFLVTKKSATFQLYIQLNITKWWVIRNVLTKKYLAKCLLIRIEKIASFAWQHYFWNWSPLAHRQSHTFLGVCQNAEGLSISNLRRGTRWRVMLPFFILSPSLFLSILPPLFFLLLFEENKQNKTKKKREKRAKGMEKKFDKKGG